MTPMTPITPQEMRKEAIRLEGFCTKERDRTAAMLRAGADALEEVERLTKALYREEEREAAVCPEDVGFEEVIALLRKRTEKAEAQVATLTERWEALKPSGDLKAALSGEFTADCYESAGNQPHDIPWTTIKDILAKAREFAEAQR